MAEVNVHGCDRRFGGASRARQWTYLSHASRKFLALRAASPRFFRCSALIRLHAFAKVAQWTT